MGIIEDQTVAKFPALLNTSQCNVCQKALNFEKDEGDAVVPSFTAKHCGKIYSLSVDIGRVGVQTDPQASEPPTVGDLKKLEAEEVQKRNAGEASAGGRNPMLIAQEKAYNEEAGKKDKKEKAEKAKEKEEKSLEKEESKQEKEIADYQKQVEKDKEKEKEKAKESSSTTTSQTSYYKGKGY